MIHKKLVKTYQSLKELFVMWKVAYVFITLTLSFQLLKNFNCHKVIFKTASTTRIWFRTHFVLLTRLPASLQEVLTAVSVIRSLKHKKNRSNIVQIHTMHLWLKCTMKT